jgi:hypothetical protein
MWRARSSHRNGRRTATDVGRCRGRRSGFVFLDFFRCVVSTSKQPPQREFSHIARVRHRIWCSEHARRLRMGDKQRRAAAEAAADIAGVRKKSLQLSLISQATEPTPPRDTTQPARSERRPRCSEWKRSAGIGGRLLQMATEAGADVAHGWHVFLLWVCTLWYASFWFSGVSIQLNFLLRHAS